MDSFFSFFFVRPQSSSRMYHFLQKLIRLLRPSQANRNLVQRVPPFIFYLFYVTYKTGRDQRVPPFNFSKIERGDPLVSSGFVGYVKKVKNERGNLCTVRKFFGTVRNFFRKFFKVSKESPLQVF